MTSKQPKNLAASVRQRLLTLSKERQEDFQLVMSRYALERLLFRLAAAKLDNQFVLKGAMLFQLGDTQTHRPTRDLDLLGKSSATPKALATLFEKVCRADVEPDGLEFLPESVQAEKIKEDQDYEGVRISLFARLERARIPLQIDVAFGDVITPAAKKIQYPSLLGFPTPIIAAYPWESVIAEKLQAMVVLGMLNSRMKDFYDLWKLAMTFSFDGTLLAQAIRATFSRRKTDLPVAIPVALTQEFYHDPQKIKQWQAFLKKSQLKDVPADLEQVCGLIAKFLLPCVMAQDFTGHWSAGGLWQM